MVHAQILVCSPQHRLAYPPIPCLASEFPDFDNIHVQKRNTDPEEESGSEKKLILSHLSHGPAGAELIFQKIKWWWYQLTHTKNARLYIMVKNNGK